MSQYKPSTVRVDRLAFSRNHILPQLGKSGWTKIGNERQQLFITSLSQKASRKTVLNVTRLCRRCFIRVRRWAHL